MEVLTDFHLALPEAIEAEQAELSREFSARNGTPIHPLRLVTELQQFLSSDLTHL